MRDFDHNEMQELAALTPSVFREYWLPVRYYCATKSEKRKFAELHDLADRHGTRVYFSLYRLG